jgi:hypothetical protein
MEGVRQKVSFELSLQNSPVGEGSSKKRDQTEPRLENVTARSASLWSRAPQGSLMTHMGEKKRQKQEVES